MKAIWPTERVNLVYGGLFGILDDPNKTFIQKPVGRMPSEGVNLNEVRCLQVMVVYAGFKSAIGPRGVGEQCRWRHYLLLRFW